MMTEEEKVLLERLASRVASLGPHAGLLLGEMLVAVRAELWATVIVQSAAVLDVMLREPTGLTSRCGGIDRASVRDSRGAFWLRDRRNGIVHYEGGRGGLMGGDDGGVLREDALRALGILAESIEGLVSDSE